MNPSVERSTSEQGRPSLKDQDAYSPAYGLACRTYIFSVKFQHADAILVSFSWYFTAIFNKMQHWFVQYQTSCYCCYSLTLSV